MRYTLIFILILSLFACSEPEDNNIDPNNPITAEEPLDKEPNENQEQTLVIESILPQFSDLGDTLNLKGKNFNKDIRLMLGYNQLQILFNNDSVIKFEVPYSGFNPDSLNIKIDNYDTIIDYKNAFQLYSPEIDSIPSNFGLRDTVVVYGKHLTNRPEAINGIIELNNDRLSVIDQNKDSIRFILPYDIIKHENDLLLKAQLREILKDKAVIIPNPVISGVSKDSLNVNENITIYGSNFFEYKKYLHEVYIGKNRAEIQEVYSDSIIVKVPLGVYENRDIEEIKVIVVDKEITAEFNLYLKSTWYQYGRIDTNGLTDGRYDFGHISRWSFEFNNSFYTLQFRGASGLYGYPDKIGFVRYNLSENTWETMPDIAIEFDPENRTQFRTFSLDDGNVYIYNERETNNFYKYNLVSGTLTPLKDFEGVDVLQQPMGFVLNGTFYFGMGYSTEDSFNPNRKLWKYNEQNNSWVYVSEMPFVEGQGYSFYTSNFIKNGRAYICNGEALYDVWEFTPDVTWTRKTDLFNPVSQTAFTQTENKGIYYQGIGINEIAGIFHEYNIDLDEYSIREDLAIEGYFLEQRAMFTNNGFVYFIGYTSRVDLPDYSAIKRYDHVVLRTELSNFD
ncbi:MAG: IPT/TIG domain-containing protein [Maribacter litoralis]|uniref:IPT/TIG domain-containing protein n=1 Tax=Maribacter litoralis TaxID=2059726 RepID=UPI003297B044